MPEEEERHTDGVNIMNSKTNRPSVIVTTQSIDSVQNVGHQIEDNESLNLSEDEDSVK